MTDLGFFCILTFVGWSESPDDIRKLRGVAQVVERYFREVEAASSSLVTPTGENTVNAKVYSVFSWLFLIEFDRTESLMKRLKECGVYVAASNHHFDRTPSIEEMVKRMETMDHFGADILKLAVMPKSDEDLMSLLTATVMMKRRTEKPVITMSMGKTGVLSRLCGEASGSAVTFAAGIKASAPGQIPAERMRRTLQLLHESFT